MAVFAVVFAVGTYFIGVPTSDPLIAFGWLWLATIAWRNYLPWKQHLLFLRDWLPISLLLVVYNVSRSFADDFFDPHVTEMIHADIDMFGWFTGGQVPTTWLQEHLYHPGVVQWWEVVVTLVYVSHFLTVPTVAVILWVRTRFQWARFIRRWFTLCVFGLITYFLYPAAPPWWAGERGYLNAPVERISTNGWDAIGLHGAGNTLNALQVEQSNPVAAMPSLHTAWAMMAVAFFLPMVRRRWWPLLLAYPLAMTFTLVYTGEHYVIDVLVGWAYVAAVFVVVGLVERRWFRPLDLPRD
ncbi:phosphatase PAP2 family protein [Symbioplanes lichenis]|uniref:phosphatase PAP2 family protein n=1 Tax=Symbioplanes lichenis TaxID=1629072 RepID=UPI0027399A8F|nr:phosphatase PAP2 family protein [Actinoplanes lichenis]